MPNSPGTATTNADSIVSPGGTAEITSGRFTLRYDWGEDGKIKQNSGSAYPQWGDGWVFEPALFAVHFDGNTSTDLRVVSTHTQEQFTRISLKDSAYDFYVDLVFHSISEHNIIETWVEIQHKEPKPITIQSVASAAIQIENGDYYLTQFSGDWANEANMVSEPLRNGIKILDSKLAVRAHQFCAPWFILSEGPLSEDSGTVIAGSLAWSGSFRFSFERLPNGKISTICGINPFASAFQLEPGEQFTTPKMVLAGSDCGAGEISRNLHRYVRQSVVRDGNKPRSILLNNWEATFFSFDEPKLLSLFKGAQDMGIDLFLLDDGWFGNKYPRNDDTQGLGDWQTNTEKLPNGINYLADIALAHSLRFGLWLEPEMVNPGSELFEQHPDWVIRQPNRELELQRNQLALDLSNPEVQQFTYSVLDNVLRAAPNISYIKWDCNRYVTQAGSQYLPQDQQTLLPITYTQGLYKVMERLKAEHPTVEVMMCSGGGGRVDYGSLKFAHELWPSDMTDPVRRIFIQWGFSHFIPAIACASHVTSWGERPLKFAFDVAMSCRLGLDLDIDKLSAEERLFCRRAIATYRKFQDTVQFGDLYRLESPYEEPRASILYRKGSQMVAFAFSTEGAPESNLKFKGLEPETSYELTETNLPDGEKVLGIFSGQLLMSSGYPMPKMAPLSSSVILLNPEK
jgi:alpha-galactosidase